MGVNNFDFIAPFYDRLSQVVFGKQLLKSQIYYLSQVRTTDRVLVIGGGTGELLEYLPSCLEVDYVEKSSKMIGLAKNRATLTKINFIHQDFFKFNTKKSYDVIICPFFLDCFGTSNLIRAMNKIKKMIQAKGSLVVTDFSSSISGNLLERVMHFFFVVFSNLESTRLKNIHSYVVETGFFMKEEEFFYQKSIFSRLYGNL